MRILTRYIVFDLLKVFVLIFVCMTAFIFIILTGKLAIEEGLGLVPVIRTFPYILPQAMQFTLPGAMLLATVTIYGRIADSNEVVALKSLGINPLILVWPTLILSILLSFGAVVLNDIAVSWGRGGVQRVLLESFDEILYARLRNTGSFSKDGLTIAAPIVEGEWLINPYVTYTSRDSDTVTIGTAAEAKIKFDQQEETIWLTCFNADIEGADEFSGYHPGKIQWPIQLAELSGSKSRKRSPSQYALSEIGPSKVVQDELITQLNQEMTAAVGQALMTGRMFELSQENWQSRQVAKKIAISKLHRLHTEPHRRWANGFSCLCFVMIGAPMAIRLRHGEIWGSFFACFLPILLVYYPMLAGCLDLAKDGVLPPQAVWLGNFVLAAWGVWLVRRVVRF